MCILNIHLSKNKFIYRHSRQIFAEIIILWFQVIWITCICLSHKKNKEKNKFNIHKYNIYEIIKIDIKMFNIINECLLVFNISLMK